MILTELRFLDFSLDSEDYTYKMKIVTFLNEKGLDYWNSKIPEKIQERYKDDPEYLSKY
ncbi:hypothetical protein [Flammeovirga sp. SJP92]|uniref:hypothetical protein n=1 Tax=Flammeovirga sp. SJP92 TaxID=1775430 RepID=UPI0012F81474|nr:hypothetical protein [Flammeovirga sp. SJP92]